MTSGLTDVEIELAMLRSGTSAAETEFPSPVNHSQPPPFTTG